MQVQCAHCELRQPRRLNKDNQAFPGTQIVRAGRLSLPPADLVPAPHQAETRERNDCYAAAGACSARLT